MPNENFSSPKSKKLYLVLGLVLIVVFIAAVWATTKQKPADQPTGENQEVTQNEEGAPTESTTATNTPAALKDAKTVVPGANPISKDNKVLTPEGKPVKNDALPMDPAAPRQTPPVDAKVLSKEVTKIGASAAGFSPSSFTVSKGAPVTLSLSSTDGYTHVMVFSDPSLSAVAMGVAPGETRAISFNAPTTAGEYSFRCTVPGHEARGEKGVMIVK